MPTETEVMQFLTQNWPSIGATAIFSALYARLHKVLAQIETAQRDAASALRSINRVIRLHCKRHPEDIETLMVSDDSEEDE